MKNQRFSEKEVALVIRRAADIDARGAGSGGGMSVEEIESVALEAGIGIEAVRTALAEIGGEGDQREGLLHAPVSRRATTRIKRQLTRDQLQALVQAIEEESGRPGTVSEALGTVRWTAADGRGAVTTQVSLSTGPEETRIAVHERVSDAVSRVAHVLPTAWGAVLGMGLTASISANPLTTVIGVAAAASAGLLVGRGVLTWRSRRSRIRVERLAARLSETARALLPGTSAAEAPEEETEVPITTTAERKADR